MAKIMWVNTKAQWPPAVLKIDGKKVTKVDEVEMGDLPEGVVFSPDGKYLYVGNQQEAQAAGPAGLDARPRRRLTHEAKSV